METLAADLAPANAETTTAATTNADANVGTSTGDGSAPSGTEAATPAPPKKDAVQERIDKLTREKYDNARLADQRGYELERERAERQRIEGELNELRKAPTSQVAPDKFPTLTEFGYDEDKYAAAVIAFNKATTEAAKEAGKIGAQEALQAEREAEQQRKVGESWSKKEAEFIKSKPDYVQKVVEGGKRKDWACTPEMAAVIKESEVGPQVAYHLAENPDKALLIAQLPPLAQAREIGRIEAAIEVAKTQKPAVSQAPPPVQKVDAADAPVEKSPSDMSDAEFAKWRKRQIAQRRNS